MILIKLLAVVLSLVLVTGMASPAFAGIPGPTIECTANLEGSQEVPPVETEGSGSATLSLDANTGLLDWDIVFSDLSSDNTASHIHGPAPAGVNAGVQVGLGTGSPLIGSTNIDADQEADLLAGLWYINIHTENNPGGEIRGQITCEGQQVAGGLLPIDSAALVLAGLSSIFVFMVPAVAGFVGAGIYLVKFRANKE